MSNTIFNKYLLSEKYCLNLNNLFIYLILFILFSIIKFEILNVQKIRFSK